MMASSPICLLSKASKTKSWLWHRHLSHLNIGAINPLARHGLVCGLPKLKFEKDHLCSACAMGKRKKKPHKPKSKDTNQEKLYPLHMDLCGLIRVTSVNGKKIMSMTKEQQQALGDALVPREQRLMIGNCNYRLSTTFKPNEPTFQVALDVLTLTPFYLAFLITASVPAVYMQEFWATITYQKHNIRFKMNKKSYSFDMETFINMLLICLKLPGQKFVDPPIE
ncbi:retrovirus-related pol polyprotein from transposon TNT 1-94 [Tanacetum coccineum]